MRRSFLFLALGCAAFAAGASGETPPPSDAPAEQRADAGLRAVLDPVTKRPTQPKTPDQRATQVFGVKRPNRALMWVEQRQDGVKTLHTEGQAKMATFARIRPDGAVEYHCVPGSPEHAGHDHAHDEAGRE